MKTMSIFWKSEKEPITSRDESGKPAEGCRYFINEDGKKIITRWKNGLLDGDYIDPNGNTVTLPAVESPGHIEYWRAGLLHRDSGPAICSQGFTEIEFWKNNKRLSEDNFSNEQ